MKLEKLAGARLCRTLVTGKHFGTYSKTTVEIGSFKQGAM